MDFYYLITVFMQSSSMYANIITNIFCVLKIMFKISVQKYTNLYISILDYGIGHLRNIPKMNILL